MVLPGIINSNEFYSNYYLESVLTDDIKEVSKRWDDESNAKLEENPDTDLSTPVEKFKEIRLFNQKSLTL